MKTMKNIICLLASCLFVFNVLAGNIAVKAADGDTPKYEISLVGEDFYPNILFSEDPLANATRGDVILSISDMDLAVNPVTVKLCNEDQGAFRDFQVNRNNYGFALSYLPAGTYYLQIWQGSKQLKCFKVVKKN